VGNSVAVLLQIYLSICVPKMIKMQCGLLKLLQKYKGAIFLPHSVVHAMAVVSFADIL